MDKSENKPAIGMLGGTFDPVHFGHLRTALDVVEQLQLDQLRLIPCTRSPHRQAPVASGPQRRLMLELAIKNHPRLIVDDRELQRPGPSYTVDTLLSLREDFPDNPLFVLIGTDAFQALPHWSRWEQLGELAHIVVMRRPDEPLALEGTFADWYQQHLAEPADRTRPAGGIWPVNVTQLAISASDIRARLRAGRDVRYLLPEAVIALISQMGLYRDGEPDTDG